MCNERGDGKMKNVTICVNCSNCKKVQRGNIRAGWPVTKYGCIAHHKDQINYVTGEVIPAKDIPLCEDINTEGNCKDYLPKQQ